MIGYFDQRKLLMKIYNILSTVFWIARQFFIPNPFDALGDGIIIFIGAAPVSLSPFILNLISDPFVALITFLIVRLYYEPRSTPAIGSILYMIFYAIHIGLIYLILLVFPTIWLMVLIGVVYIGLHVFLRNSINKMQDFYID